MLTPIGWTLAAQSATRPVVSLAAWMPLSVNCTKLMYVGMMLLLQLIPDSLPTHSILPGPARDASEKARWLTRTRPGPPAVLAGAAIVGINSNDAVNYPDDSNHKLVYRGQFDDSRPDNDKPITGADLRAALDAVLANKPVGTDQKASVGCNIKWKADNEPKY
jgi:hypothetical protein